MRRIIGVAAMPELVSIALVCRNVDAKDLGSATGHPANHFLRRSIGAKNLIVMGTTSVLAQSGLQVCVVVLQSLL